MAEEFAKFKRFEYRALAGCKLHKFVSPAWQAPIPTWPGAFGASLRLV